jgi:hypothetical protein
METKEEQHIEIAKAKVEIKGKDNERYMYLIDSSGLDYSIGRDSLNL